jgi:hypothetical protein
MKDAGCGILAPWPYVCVIPSSLRKLFFWQNQGHFTVTTNVRKGIKLAAWTFGMMFAGMILGAKSSYSLTWYGGLVSSPAAILVGACLGFVLGCIFTLK